MVLQMTAKKKLTIAVAVLAAIIIGAIAVKAFIVPLASGIAQRAEAETSIVQEMATSVRLGESERAQVESYENNVLDIADLLAANVWVNADGDEIRFGRGYFVYEKDGQQPRAGKFVMGSVKEETKNEKDATESIREIAVIGDNGPTVARLVASTDKKRTEKVTVESSAFGTTGAFELSKPERSIKVEKPDAKVVELMGGEEAFAKQSEKIADYVARKAPSATSAQWTGKVTLDYQDGKVDVNYALDDRSNTKIVASVNMKDSSLELKKG